MNGAQQAGVTTNPRIAQSHSPTQIARKGTDVHNGGKPSVGIKAQIANMNQTFHSGQKQSSTGPPIRTNNMI